MKIFALVAVWVTIASSVQAETITWSSELLASDGSNVLTTGTEHVGISYGAGGADSRVINGVNFRANEAAGNHDNPSWSGWIDNRNANATRYGAAGTDLKELTNDIIYGPTLVLGINNLTIGNRYRIQLISYDADNWWNSPEAAIERWQTITATGDVGFDFQHGTESPYSSIDDVGAALVIGTWTAGASEIRFTITTRALNDNAILNGFVVQDITQAANISPVHNSQGVALDAELIWQVLGELANPDFDVYFGHDKDDVIAGDRSVYQGSQTQMTYTPESLQPATTYYWRIDVIDSGTLYPGSVWQFTTLPPDLPKCLASLADVNLDCIVDITDLTLMASQWLDGTCPELMCTDLDRVDLTDFSLLAGDWLTSGSSMVISEFMAANEKTLVDNFGDFSDWIEIKNLGDTPQDLQGWYLTDDKNRLDKWAFPNAEIGANGHLVVFASGRNLVNDPNYLHTNFQLDSEGEYLALVRPDFSIAHEFNPQYPPQMKDISYGLTITDGYERLTTGYFLTPSPGSDNGIAVAYLGPHIDHVAREPAEPGQAETVVVTARITPSVEPVDSVSLHYRVMYEAETVVDMYDDGQHEDGNAGDGIYGGVIPAGAAAPGAMLRYYVTAVDSNGRDNRNPPLLGLIGDRSPEYYGAVIADPTLTSNLPIFHWFLEDPEAARTDAGTRCSAWFNGEFYDNFFVRRRGFTTAEWPKRKFKFDFNKGNHFRFMAGLGRVEEINLQSHQYEIGPTSYMRETIAFQFMRDVGVPAPLAYHIQLRQNGAFYGLYSIIEQIDEEFLDRNGFDAAGLMYKATDSHTLGNLRPNPGNDGYRIVIPENGTFDALAAFCEGINASNSNRLAYVMDNVNLPQVINEMAAHSTMIHHDRLPKNYYMYRNPKTLEWYRFPWDVEMAFAVGDFLTNTHFNTPLYGDSEHPQSIGSDNYNHLCDAILDLPVTREMFMRRLRTLMDTYLEPSPGGYFETWVNNTKSLIEAEADVDNAKWLSGDIDAGVDAILKVSLPVRRNQLFSIYGPSGVGYIPETQAADPQINIGTVEFNPPSYNQDEEYIELVNNNSYAVDVSGWRIGGGVEFTFQAGTVIPADTSLYVSPDVVAFRHRAVSPKGREGHFVVGNYKGHLSSWGETLTLTDPVNRVVDSVTYAGNPSDQQRYLRITEIMYHSSDPDSDSIYNNEDFDFIELSNIGEQALDLTGAKLTDGIRYAFSPPQTIGEVDLVGMTDTWKYNQQCTDLGTAWRGYAYDDSSWSSGPALLYAESADLPAAKNTPLTIGGVTYYFRKHFYLDANPQTDDIVLRLNTVIDDGAVFYINGVEVYRLGMDKGIVEYGTFALRSVDDAMAEGPFTIPADSLVNGDNVIAVEVHQQKIDSSDLAFGLTLDAAVTTNSHTVPVYLDAGESVVLVKNRTAFESHYGTDLNIAGEYEGSLDNGGESLKLEDYTNSTILEFHYDDAWYDITDGKGFSLTIKDPGNSVLDSWDSKNAWRPSLYSGGSPGKEDTGVIPEIGSIVINEILAHSDADFDWIELHNTTDVDINIGGWFLSDNNNDDPNRMKYEIPPTNVPGGGYVVFYENLHFGNPSDPGCHVPFALSENGETVYLQSGQDGVLTGYYEEEKFGASERDIAFGRYRKSTGTVNFVPMSANTPGSANVYPKVGPIVITEIMYHPAMNVDAEYVELLNNSESPVTLYDFETNQPWRFVDDADNPGLEYYFPMDPPVTIAHNEKILLIKNTDAFKREYGQASLDGITCYEWIDGSLSNGGEKPELQMPGDMDESMKRYYIRVDRVSYEDIFPWPTEPDGTGQSLVKKPGSINLYGNDVINWQALTPTPGE